MNHLAKDCLQGRESRPPTQYSNHVQIAPSEGQTEGHPQADGACNRVLCDTESAVIAKQHDENDHWEFGNFPEVNYSKDVATSVISILKRISISIIIPFFSQ